MVVAAGRAVGVRAGQDQIGVGVSVAELFLQTLEDGQLDSVGDEGDFAGDIREAGLILRIGDDEGAGEEALAESLADLLRMDVTEHLNAPDRQGDVAAGTADAILVGMACDRSGEHQEQE